MSRKVIEIEDFIKLQNLQEEHAIPFAASITACICELLNYYAQRGFDPIKIVLNDLVTPAAFQRNSCVWAKQIIPHVILPNVRTYKRPGQTFIEASKTAFHQNWLKSLKQRLKSQRIVIIPNSCVPKAYRANPYILTTRLGKQDIHIQVKPSSKQLTIIRQTS